MAVESTRTGEKLTGNHVLLVDYYVTKHSMIGSCPGLLPGREGVASKKKNIAYVRTRYAAGNNAKRSEFNTWFV